MRRITADTINALVAGVRRGEHRAGARLMRLVDDRHPLAFDALRQLFPHTGGARVIGITGNPGSGKSTLTDQLIAHYRGQGKTVGVVAVDPSSPFTGGAILGDRIRMSDHATDDGVFIRSLATRGHLGGLSRSTHDVVQILDAMGFDVILLETVGVGQDEIEVVRLAHTSIVVMVPGMGDDIQSIKAGILEIADIFAVNKADRDGADRVVKDLKALELLASPDLRRLAQARGHHGPQAPVLARDDHDHGDHRDHRDEPGAAGEAEPPWLAPILKTVALRGEGVDELAQAIEDHSAFLARTARPGGEGRARQRRREAHGLDSLILDRVMAAVGERLDASEGGRWGLYDRLVRRDTDPYTEADRILDELLRGDDGLPAEQGSRGEA